MTNKDIRQVKLFTAILICVIVVLNNPLLGLASLSGLFIGYLVFTDEEYINEEEYMTKSDLIKRLEEIENYCDNIEGDMCDDSAWPFSNGLSNASDMLYDLIEEIKKEEF